MKKIFFAILAVALLSSCGPTALYYWGGPANSMPTVYENLAYKHYDKQTSKSICKLFCMYEDMVVNPGGTRKVPPPGICAEYAYLISQPEMVNIFIENATPKQKKVFANDNFIEYFTNRAPELFEMEMELYPESIKFIEPLLNKIVGK